MGTRNIWDELKQYTQSRIGLKRVGHAVGTHENLEFQWAHAQARDAIHTPWNWNTLQNQLLSWGSPSYILKTQIQTRSEYLLRPDLGRLLDEKSKIYLNEFKKKHIDIVLMITNGLSSQAIHTHAFSFLELLLKSLQERKHSYVLFLIPNARVALGDEVGELLKPKLSLTLVGERPGLSSPDSMGLYLTYEPRVGRTDADRNCLSNIREPHGLSYTQALTKTLYLIEESLTKRLSGVDLKDESERVGFLKKERDRL